MSGEIRRGSSAIKSANATQPIRKGYQHLKDEKDELEADLEWAMERIEELEDGQS